jgi:hypothetical protein
MIDLQETWKKAQGDLQDEPPTYGTVSLVFHFRDGKPDRFDIDRHETFVDDEKKVNDKK